MTCRVKAHVPDFIDHKALDPERLSVLNAAVRAFPAESEQTSVDADLQRADKAAETQEIINLIQKLKVD